MDFSIIRYDISRLIIIANELELPPFSTGIKRVLEGEIKTPTTKAEEGKLHVEYKALPLTPATQYAVLETDYDNYAVLWSCNGIGPINAQNAWIMTRARKPEPPVMQSVRIPTKLTFYKND